MFVLNLTFERFRSFSDYLSLSLYHLAYHPDEESDV